MKTIRKSQCARSCVLALLTVGYACGLAAAADFKWVDTEGKHRELRDGARPVVRYMYEALDESTPERREATFKVYHHVFSPDGSRLLTKGPGGLFPHHHGVFFGFSKVTYGDGQHCDIWHCTEKTHQAHVSFLEEDADGERAILKSSVAWRGSDGEPFAREERQVVVRTPNGGTQIDFTSHLEPIGDQEIHLDGDPQHAGFHFRATQKVPDKTAKQTYYIRTDGKGKEGATRNWNHNDSDDPINPECTNRPWLAMSMVLDGDRYTILYLDHPDNPKPARFSERDYGRFGSYFVTDVTPEKPLDVQYRLWVQKGEMTAAECAELSKEFVGG